MFNILDITREQILAIICLTLSGWLSYGLSKPGNFHACLSCEHNSFRELCNPSDKLGPFKELQAARPGQSACTNRERAIPSKIAGALMRGVRERGACSS